MSFKQAKFHDISFTHWLLKLSPVINDQNCLVPHRVKSIKSHSKESMGKKIKRQFWTKFRTKILFTIILILARSEISLSISFMVLFAKFHMKCCKLSFGIYTFMEWSLNQLLANHTCADKSFSSCLTEDGNGRNRKMEIILF